LAGIPIFDELKKRSFSFHAQKLLQAGLSRWISPNSTSLRVLCILGRGHILEIYLVVLPEIIGCAEKEGNSCGRFAVRL
jgi:hypothetical protein